MLDHSESTVPERLLVFKTDVQGSIEALTSLTSSLPKHEGTMIRYVQQCAAMCSMCSNVFLCFGSPCLRWDAAVRCRVVRAAVGAINDTDIELAATLGGQ